MRSFEWTVGKGPTLRRTMALLALALVIASANAQAQEEMEPQFPQQQSARDLLMACASSRLSSIGRERRRYCAGFVSGVEEAERVLHPGEPAKRSFCTPPDVSASALAAAFVRYGAGHDEELDWPAARVVLLALEHTWPCKAPEGQASDE